MSSVPKLRLSPEEYLALERKADFKSEYVDGEVFALAGVSFAHSLITGNVFAALHSRLRGKGCTVHPTDLKVRVGRAGLFCYPDVIVVCGAPEFVDGERDVLTNPRLLVEVLSPSTEAWDRGGKFARYRRLDSLCAVLLVAQDVARVEQYARGDDGRWNLTEAEGLAGSLLVPSLSVDLPLAEVYENVALPAAE